MTTISRKITLVARQIRIERTHGMPLRLTALNVWHILRRA
jgi:hypothetical protein